MANWEAGPASSGNPGSALGTTGANTETATGFNAGTRLAWASKPVTESSYCDGGDGVDEDGDEDTEGDADVDGDADAERVRNGTASLSVETGTNGEALVASWPGPSEGVAGVDTIDSEAAVTSWVKFAGPLVFVVVGLSCLVLH